jgi:hypothetical protein
MDQTERGGVSRRSANLVAVAYLVTLLLIDLRFRLGVAGLVLALAGFVAIVAWPEVAPRLSRRVGREVRSALIFDQTERLVEQTKSLLGQPEFQARVSPEVRDGFGRIAARLDQIASIIRHDPNKHPYAEWFHGSYARPIRDLTRHYVNLSSRGVASARPALERTEVELPRIERQLDELFEAIHRGDVSALKSINEMMELQDRGRPPPQ